MYYIDIKFRRDFFFKLIITLKLLSKVFMKMKREGKREMIEKKNRG